MSKTFDKTSHNYNSKEKREGNNMFLKRFLALAVLASALGFVSQPLSAQDVIKIGDINSYKRLPAHTIPYKQGVTLALEEINKAGGVLGKKTGTYLP